MSAWKLLNLINLPLSILQNAFNASMQAKQNKHNEKLVDMQNKAAETQAEKAYIRSLPSNQMQNMRSAGISDFAAAQGISGGGTYQPAPVNTSQGQAPQIDLNGAMQAITSSMQLKQEMKMQDKLLAAQKAEAQKQRDHELMLKDIDTMNQTQHDYLDYSMRERRLEFDKEVHEYNKPLIQAQINKIKSATKVDEINVTSAELDNLRKRLELENLPTLMKLSNYETMHRINKMILDYQHAVENHSLDTEAKRLQNEINSLTKDSNIDFINARNELNSYMDEIHLRKNSKANGFFGSLELFLNNYMPAILKFK